MTKNWLSAKQQYTNNNLSSPLSEWQYLYSFLLNYTTAVTAAEWGKPWRLLELIKVLTLAAE